MPEPRPHFRTRPVSWGQLFSTTGQKRYFPSYKTRLSIEEKGHKREYSKSATTTGRYIKHCNFLRKHGESINVFADIGCAISAGAPTTIEAREALGKNARVLAVDVFNSSAEIEEILGREGIEIRKHDIVREPLPFQCDAIGFRNVAQWMDHSDRRRALFNVWKSLKVGGFLLGALEGRDFHVGVPKGSAEGNEFALRKTARGWEEIILD